MHSRTVNIDGEVHYADFGGPASGPTVVLVHGLGGSHVNWLAVGPALSRHRRVVAVDLPGFGLTPLSGRSPGLDAHLQLIRRFIETVAGGQAVVFGHSMGGMLSLMLAASAPDLVRTLVLVSPPLPRPPGTSLDRAVALTVGAYLVPGVGRALLRYRSATRTPEQLSRDLLELCCVDPSRVPPEVFEAHVGMNVRRREMPWVADAFLGSTRSLVGALARRPRLRAMIAAVRAPTMLVQGDRDRLVPVGAARAAALLRPDWELAILEGIGHIPQMEAPARFLELADAFLDRHAD